MKVLLIELLMFALASISAVFASQSFSPRPHLELPKQATLPAGQHFASPIDYPWQAWVSLSHFLQIGELVVFGSSELTSTSETAFQRFYPKHCHKPVLTVGRAGFQSLSILLALNEVRRSLGAQSRITVILSPIWFVERGTPSSELLRNLRARQVLEMAADPATPQVVSGALTRAARNKRDELTGLYPDWLLLRFPFLAKNLNEKRPDFSTTQLTLDWSSIEKKDTPWVELVHRWLDIDLREGSGNPYGVKEHVFEKLQGKKLPLNASTLDPYEREYKDLLSLSRFLKEHSIKAHFVVQPIHRRLYTQLEPYDRLFEKIKTNLENDGHLFTDYFVEPFDLSLLSDNQHFTDSAMVRLEEIECKR